MPRLGKITSIYILEFNWEKRYIPYVIRKFPSLLKALCLIEQKIDIQTTYKLHHTYSISVMNKLKRGCLIMSCSSGQCNCNQYGGSGGSGQGCIRDVIRRIIEAQKRVENTTSITCATSCERSIEDLLSPSRDTRPPRHTTIPIMLINKCGKPFVGSGIVNRDGNGGRREFFECVESPVFRVRDFTRGSENCVVLELLSPVHRRGDGDGHGHEHEHHASVGGANSCDFFRGGRIHNFRSTGVCITVDLDCFCGITCLDPITPVPL